LLRRIAADTYPPALDCSLAAGFVTDFSENAPLRVLGADAAAAVGSIDKRRALPPIIIRTECAPSAATGFYPPLQAASAAIPAHARRPSQTRSVRTGAWRGRWRAFPGWIEMGAPSGLPSSPCYGASVSSLRCPAGFGNVRWRAPGRHWRRPFTLPMQ